MGFPEAVLVKRSSAVLCALYVVLGTSLASAQTVILRHAPPGSALELVLEANPVGAAKADAGGTATVTAKSVEGQMDANIWFETCDNDHRVILAKPGAALPTTACRRIQIGGLYLVQRVTSIVIDTSATSSLLIRQGPAYANWLIDARPEVAKAATETETRTAGSSSASAAASKPLPPLSGPTAFGGAGLGTTLHFGEQACGTVTCTWDEPIQYGGGIGWWFNDYFGAEGQYGYLGKLKVTANESDYQFSTTREGGFLAASGRAGLRKGRFRPFGRAGMSLGRSTLTTTQTMGAGTETLAVRTRGWAPIFGGGLEVWLSPRLGLYVDGQRLGLKGKDDRDSGIEIDDTLLTAKAGVTLRLR